MSGDELDDILATLGQQGCLFVFTFEIEAGSDGGRGYAGDSMVGLAGFEPATS